MKLLAIIIIAAVVIWMVANAVLFLLPYMLAAIATVWVVGAVGRLVDGSPPHSGEDGKK